MSPFYTKEGEIWKKVEGETIQVGPELEDVITVNASENPTKHVLTTKGNVFGIIEYPHVITPRTSPAEVDKTRIVVFHSTKSDKEVIYKPE